MRKPTFIVGLAIGYVLGARAGRERYEQLVKSARAAAQNPRVQDAARQAKEAAGAAAGKAADSVTGAVGDKLPHAVADRVRSLRHKPEEDDGWGTEKI